MLEGISGVDLKSHCKGSFPDKLAPTTSPDLFYGRLSR